MGILIGLALGIGVLFYFTIIKKNKQVDTNNSGDIPNTSSCKRYEVVIIDTTKVENLAWLDCDNKPQGGVVQNGQNFCAKSIIYHNPTNLELKESGIC